MKKLNNESREILSKIESQAKEKGMEFKIKEK